MIRLSALAIYVIGAALYASKDWYKSLCALILLMAVVEHPDMPKTILGIQGLNPWNLLLMAVVAGWASARSKEKLKWDLPAHITVMLALYFGVIIVGFVRMMLNRDYLDESALSLTSEYLVNTLKWVIPGLLLYDGCRTRERFRMAMLCVLGVYVLLGVQVIRWMPLSAAVSGDSLSERSLKILVNEVGYHRVNISSMLAGAAWAVFAGRALAESGKQNAAILVASVVTLFGQALTGGRAGYVTFAGVGFVLCVLRWRRYLLLAPVAVVAILIIAPGVAERMLEGFSPSTRSVPTRVQQVQGSDAGADAYTITAGRNLIWPYVIGKIADRPWIGYGRLAMVRTGLTHFLSTQLDEGFSHPHNAYLEMLFDNGIVGFVLVMPFYALLLLRSFTLFRDSRSPVFVAVGGATAAMILGLLIASLGSQTFYPREGWMGMWCLMFLLLRVWVQRGLVLSAQVDTGMRGLGAARGQAGRDRLLRMPAGMPVPPTAPLPAPAPAVAGEPPRRFRRAPMIVDEPKTISEEALWGTPPPDPTPVRRLSPPTQVKFRRAV
jgi:O-antigen ligase